MCVQWPLIAALITAVCAQRIALHWCNRQVCLLHNYCTRSTRPKQAHSFGCRHPATCQSQASAVSAKLDYAM